MNQKSNTSAVAILAVVLFALIGFAILYVSVIAPSTQPVVELVVTQCANIVCP
jgi:hypothetical protein